jgi:hypothetical protein
MFSFSRVSFRLRCLPTVSWCSVSLLTFRPRRRRRYVLQKRRWGMPQYLTSQQDERVRILSSFSFKRSELENSHLEIVLNFWLFRRTLSSGMSHRLAVVRTDFSEDRIASIIRVRRIGELGTKLAVINNRRTQRTSVASCSLCCS